MKRENLLETSLKENWTTFQMAMSLSKYIMRLLIIRMHYPQWATRGVTKNYPHTPGIDAAGTVVECKTPQFKAGDKVLVTSYDLGMNTDGAFAEYIQVPEGWVVPLPNGLNLRECMIIGTAGLTAAIGLYKLEMMGQNPEQGPIIISGASGGVGSMAVGILAKAGYQVIASTGKENVEEFLKNIGASEVVDREFANDDSSRPLMKPKWAGGY